MGVRVYLMCLLSRDPRRRILQLELGYLSHYSDDVVGWTATIDSGQEENMLLPSVAPTQPRYRRYSDRSVMLAISIWIAWSPPVTLIGVMLTHKDSFTFA
jgi:hypothetical protein